MNRILSLVIICIITATVVEATLPARELFNANRAAMISAAKLSLSEDGVEKLQNILTRKVEQDRVVFDSAFFLKPALSLDLQRNDVSRVKKFLGIVNDSKLVEGNLVGGGRFDKESRSFRVVYSLEESASCETRFSMNPEWSSPLHRLCRAKGALKLYMQVLNRTLLTYINFIVFVEGPFVLRPTYRGGK